VRRIDWEGVISTVLGLGCTLAVVGGGGAMMIGAAGSTLITIGDSLKPHRLTLLRLSYYGGIFCGGGMIVFGAIALTARTIGERQARQEHHDSILTSPYACKGCRHFHGQTYFGEKGASTLICGMHPYGWQHENCPDYESTLEA